MTRCSSSTNLSELTPLSCASNRTHPITSLSNINAGVSLGSCPKTQQHAFSSAQPPDELFTWSGTPARLWTDTPGYPFICPRTWSTAGQHLPQLIPFIIVFMSCDDLGIWLQLGT